MEPALERRRLRRLRVVAGIALAGAAIFAAGTAMLIRGVSSGFEHQFAAPVGSVPDSTTFLVAGIGFLIALAGIGMLLGSLVSWCIVRRPQFRLRTCFIGCAILAVVLTCVPRAVRLAAQAGITANAEGVTVERAQEGRLSSPYVVEMSIPLSSEWLLLVVSPAAIVVFFVGQVYR